MNSIFKSEIKKEELKLYPVQKFTGEIVVIDNASDLPKVIDELRMYPVLGFDTETRPAFKRGVNYKVALLQLACEHKAWLFRLNLIGFPDILANFLGQNSVCKPGVAISDDIKALKILNRFNNAGFVELQTMVQEFGITDAGLKKLAAIILGFSISKRQQITNWANAKLSSSQITYAATDAWVCYQIYQKLINIKQKHTKTNG